MIKKIKVFIKKQNAERHAYLIILLVFQYSFLKEHFLICASYDIKKHLKCTNCTFEAFLTYLNCTFCDTTRQIN